MYPAANGRFHSPAMVSVPLHGSSVLHVTPSRLQRLILFYVLFARRPPPPRTIPCSLLTVLFLRFRSYSHIFLTWFAEKPPALETSYHMSSCCPATQRSRYVCEPEGLGNDVVRPPCNLRASCNELTGRRSPQFTTATTPSALTLKPPRALLLVH